MQSMTTILSYLKSATNTQRNTSPGENRNRIEKSTFPMMNTMALLWTASLRTSGTQTGTLALPPPLYINKFAITTQIADTHNKHHHWKIKLLTMELGSHSPILFQDTFSHHNDIHTRDNPPIFPSNTLPDAHRPQTKQISLPITKTH